MFRARHTPLPLPQPGSAQGGLPPSPSYVHESRPRGPGKAARLRAWDAGPCPGCPAKPPALWLGEASRAGLHKVNPTAARGAGAGGRGRLLLTAPLRRDKGRALPAAG